MAINENQMQNLPPELLLQVLGHIKRPSTLKSLCLTSQRLKVLVILLLYNEVILDADDSHSTANTAFFNASGGHEDTALRTGRAQEPLF